MKLMKKLKYVLIIVALFFISTFNIAFADVGSFESYDSGSSWSSSSSDWSSSSSSWDYDSDSDYSSSGDGSFFFFGDVAGIVIFIIIMIIFYVVKYYFGNNNQTQRPPQMNMNNLGDENAVYEKVKAVDPLFNKEEFISWSKTLFVKLQEAWTERNWETIRTFETNELFEQHKRQLQGYIDNKQINVMERICVKSARLGEFTQTADKDILTVVLSSKMIGYIINEDTKAVIKGDKNTERHSVYKLTFVRAKGIKTQEATGKVKTTNCPNCGAPTSITSSGRCEYCGSVITTDKHDWALSDLTKIG